MVAAAKASGMDILKFTQARCMTIGWGGERRVLAESNKMQPLRGMFLNTAQQIMVIECVGRKDWIGMGKHKLTHKDSYALEKIPLL